MVFYSSNFDGGEPDAEKDDEVNEVLDEGT